MFFQNKKTMKVSVECQTKDLKSGIESNGRFTRSKLRLNSSNLIETNRKNPYDSEQNSVQVFY